MSSTDPRPLVTVTRHGDGGHVAELVLDRPEAMNAVSTAMARDLGAACAALAADESVRCVVVTSTSPKAFCVGADLKERNSFTDADLMAQRPVARAAYGGVLDLPVPALAAVDGFALGGGLEIALSCDLVVAGESAVVGPAGGVSVGVIPGGGGTQLLTRRVGWSRAAGMIFTAAGCRPPRPVRSGWWTRWCRRARPRGPGRWRSPPGSPPTRRSGCARPSGRCGSEPTSTWPPGWRSRTAAGARRRSPATARRALLPLPRNAARRGPGR